MVRPLSPSLRPWGPLWVRVLPGQPGLLISRLALLGLGLGWKTPLRLPC